MAVVGVWSSPSEASALAATRAAFSWAFAAVFMGFSWSSMRETSLGFSAGIETCGVLPPFQKRDLLLLRRTEGSFACESISGLAPLQQWRTIVKSSCFSNSPQMFPRSFEEKRVVLFVPARFFYFLFLASISLAAPRWLTYLHGLPGQRLRHLQLGCLQCRYGRPL